MITSNIETITPELARIYLQNNSMNRPVVQNVVLRYKSAMLNSEWQISGEPIIFSYDTSLLDGQHRLMACILSNKNFDTMVIRGVDKSTFAVMNSGKPRNHSHVLSIGNFANASRLAAGAKSYLSYGRTVQHSKSDISTTQVLEAARNNPSLIYWAARHSKNETNKKLPASIIGLLAKAEEFYGREKIDLFFDKLSSGVNLNVGSPELALRNKLLFTLKITKVTPEAVRIMIIKAINFSVAERKMELFIIPNGVFIPLFNEQKFFTEEAKARINS
jgi:hypothetical protein